ncbi:hypothetical protein LJC17_02185 [Acholeplasma sp. OttesenSCG-928-E16]|nr:hypothetical protein [Acholeplasma sp. OttesenSCG-928-E16]
MKTMKVESIVFLLVFLLFLTFLIVWQFIKKKVVDKRLKIPNSFFTRVSKKINVIIIIIYSILLLIFLVLIWLNESVSDVNVIELWIMFGITIFFLLFVVLFVIQINLDYEAIIGDNVVIRNFFRKKIFKVEDIFRIEQMDFQFYFYDRSNKQLFYSSKGTLGVYDFITYLKNNGAIISTNLEMTLKKNEANITDINIESNVINRVDLGDSKLGFTEAQIEEIKLLGISIKESLPRQTRNSITFFSLLTFVLVSIVLLVAYTGNLYPYLFYLPIILLAFLMLVIATLKGKKKRMEESDFNLGLTIYNKDNNLRIHMEKSKSNGLILSFTIYIVLGLITIIFGVTKSLEYEITPVELSDSISGLIYEYEIVDGETRIFFNNDKSEIYCINASLSRLVGFDEIREILDQNHEIDISYFGYWDIKIDGLPSKMWDVTELVVNGQVIISKQDYKENEEKGLILFIGISIIGLVVTGFSAIFLMDAINNKRKNINQLLNG